jgi:hypothetical protein
MSRIPIVVVIALFYSTSSLAVGEDPASDRFQYTPATYHVDGFGETKANAWVSLYAQFKNENTTIEEIKIAESLEGRKSALGTGIGLEVAPLFGTYGVFRTSITNDQSTYVAIGITADELFMDEADSLESRNNSEFSYGFGVNNSSYNIEYMMYMDEENSGVAAFSVGFISEF